MSGASAFATTNQTQKLTSCDPDQAMTVVLVLSEPNSSSQSSSCAA